MSNTGKQMIEGMREAVTMAKLEAENARLRAALENLDDMIVSWAKDEGFPPENSACLRLVRAALNPP